MLHSPARMQLLAGETGEEGKQGKASAKKDSMSAAQQLQMVMRGMEGGDPQGDSMVSIEQRAASKVNRWMGGGYVKVYDLGSGR